MHPDSPDSLVELKRCGNIYEIRFMRVTPSITIQKLDADHFVDLKTGEVKRMNRKTRRSQDIASVSQSLRKLRDLINANLENPDYALWVTLTYAENMRDTKRLYEDFRRFWQRFCYYLKMQGWALPEYIIAAEPQGRGAWHLHCLFLFPEKAPYVPNSMIAQKWGHGFTKTKNLTEISNPGLYLTAYLSDMELNQAMTVGQMRGRVEAVRGEDGQAKAVIKGARLGFYPVGFHLYRHSRGVKKPTVIQTTEAEACAIVGEAVLTFEKTIEISNEAGDVLNIINYRQYIKKLSEESTEAGQKKEVGCEVQCDG